MRVERLPLSGGVRVLDDLGEEMICRLSREGETRVGLSGFIGDYDTGGKLVYVRLEAAALLNNLMENGQVLPALTEMVSYLTAADKDLLVRIDISAGSFTIQKQSDEAEWVTPGTYQFSEEMRQIAIELREEGGLVGQVIFFICRDETIDRLTVGFRGPDRAGLGMSIPLTVYPQILETDLSGEAGAAKIRAFLRGDRG